jgi:hypothetical protein
MVTGAPGRSAAQSRCKSGWLMQRQNHFSSQEIRRPGWLLKELAAVHPGASSG